MSKPVAVLISDVHYNLQTLELADAAVRMAITKANDLRVPLIVCGDLHDTKANMRAECVSAMITTFALIQTACYVLRGNHDQINEKSEAHALEFLKCHNGKFINVVDTPRAAPVVRSDGLVHMFELIPYHHDPDALRAYLQTLPDGATLIMHQGLTKAAAGEYMQDHSALRPEDVHRFRVISGHYHCRQDIKVGRPRKGAVGLWSYVGNPFTLNYGEASDPEKGFQILHDNGLLEFVPTNLRKHIVIERFAPAQLTGLQDIGPKDLVWVKYHSSASDLATLTKETIAERLGLVVGESLLTNFRLDLIPTETQTSEPAPERELKSDELFDHLIEASNHDADTKDRLKGLWKETVK